MKIENKILRLREVIIKSGMSRSFIYKEMDNGNFPTSVKIGARAIGWYSHEVDEWLNSLRASEVGVQSK